MNAISFYNLDANCGQNLPSVCERFKTDAADTNTFVQPLSFGDGKPCPDGYSTFGGSINDDYARKTLFIHILI
jgi:hypothetical protein